MRSTATDPSRRAALGLLGGGLLLPFAGRARETGSLYLSAYGGRTGFGIAAFDDQAVIRWTFALPARGHGFASRSDGRAAVAFLRRPGHAAIVFDPGSGENRLTIMAAADRSFCGHGTYSADGRLLFATEAVGSTGEGVLGVYAADENYRRIAEWPTLGLDPHEVCLFPEGRHLAVANGGILMRAELPRLKLNIPDMDPSLVYIDAATGETKRQIRAPATLHQLSIRHLAIGGSGDVTVAMQFEGAAEESVPLVATHGGVNSMSPGFTFLDFPAPTLTAMRQYCGSVALNKAGSLAAITSPRGNLVVIYDRARNEIANLHAIPDVCGVATADNQGFRLSNGLGQLFRLDAGIETANSGTDVHWDNHITPVHA